MPTPFAQLQQAWNGGDYVPLCVGWPTCRLHLLRRPPSDCPPLIAPFLACRLIAFLSYLVLSAFLSYRRYSTSPKLHNKLHNKTRHPRGKRAVSNDNELADAFTNAMNREVALQNIRKTLPGDWWRLPCLSSINAIINKRNIRYAYDAAANYPTFVSGGTP